MFSIGEQQLNALQNIYQKYFVMEMVEYIKINFPTEAENKPDIAISSDISILVNEANSYFINLRYYVQYYIALSYYFKHQGFITPTEITNILKSRDYSQKEKLEMVQEILLNNGITIKWN